MQFSLSWCVICGTALLMPGLGLVYFRYCRMTRPPIGTFNRTDVVIALGIILLAQILYVIAPLWLAAGIFALGALSALYCTLEALLRPRYLAWLVGILVIIMDIVAAQIFGLHTNGFFLVNNLVILLVIIGVSNLWVQSGLKARDVVLFSLLLAILDLFATTLSPLTFTMFARLEAAPLTPILAWTSNGIILEGGLGDFLLVTTFSLALYKAFGLKASLVSIVIGLAVIALLLLTGQRRAAMIFLAPAMLAQYLVLRQSYPHERTMQEYLQQIC